MLLLLLLLSATHHGVFSLLCVLLAHMSVPLSACHAMQAVGKVPLDVNKMNIDAMSISGHKIYGPKVKCHAPFGGTKQTPGPRLSLLFFFTRPSPHPCFRRTHESEGPCKTLLPATIPNCPY